MNSLCESYSNEISLLRSLKGAASIIQLVDAIVDRDAMYIAIVMEVGEVDLSKVLQAKMRASHTTGGLPCFNPFFVRIMWQEMLESVDQVHPPPSTVMLTATRHRYHFDLIPSLTHPTLRIP